MRAKKKDQPPMTFRFSQEAQRILRELAEKQGISMTAVLELLLRKEGKEKGVE